MRQAAGFFVFNRCLSVFIGGPRFLMGARLAEVLSNAEEDPIILYDVRMCFGGVAASLNEGNRV
jgi:hypothetical protein